MSIILDISQEIWSLKYRYNNETVEDFYWRQASCFDNTNKAFKILSAQWFCLAGRPQYALGTDRTQSTLSNCFVTSYKKDSLEEILETTKRFALTHKAGGGMGVNISILRPKDVLVKTTKNTSSGAVQWLKLIDAECEVVKGGKNRRGANMAILNIWHPDIEEFITIKRTPGTLVNFNLSVGVSDKFIEAVKKDADWELIFPDTNHQLYDKIWDGNIDKWLSHDLPVITYKTVKAAYLWDLIMRNTYEHAEPGVVFLDTINKYNPLNYTEIIQATNPCGEQPLPAGGSCNLGAVNLGLMVDNPFTENAKINWERLEETVRFGVNALDKIIDINFYPLEEQEEYAKNYRPIGLGIMGLADLLVQLKLTYGSKESLNVIDKLGEFIRNIAYDESAKLAKSKGAFIKYSDEYTKTEYFKKLPKEIQDWIKQWGIRNCRLLTIAPTGTTAIVANNVSGGLEPFFELEYYRNVTMPDGSKVKKLVQPYSVYLYRKMFGENSELPSYFVTATTITPEQHLQVQAVLQKYVDSSISKTINCPEEISYEDFKDIYLKAHELGCKGVTTYRPSGIRQAVLEKVDQKQETKLTTQIYSLIPVERDLEGARSSKTYPIVGKNGENNWVTVTFDEEGKPFDVFYQLPKEAGNDDNGNHIPSIYYDRLSDTNCITRLISLCLRCNIPLARIIHTLDKSSFNMFNLAHKLKNVLIEYLDEEEFEDAGINKTCSICGGTLVFQEGCMICSSCGDSKCS